MEEDGGVVAILLHDVKNMLKHPSANPQPAVGCQAPQGHYEQLEQKEHTNKSWRNKVDKNTTLTFLPAPCMSTLQQTAPTTISLK